MLFYNGKYYIDYTWSVELYSAPRYASVVVVLN
jgi:hypothetical protein